MRIHIALLIVILLTIVSCAAPKPTPDQLLSGDYGLPPAKQQYESQIESYWYPRLIDPGSMLISYPTKPPYDEPKKAWITGLKNSFIFGWEIYHHVNAKNRLGGYTGGDYYRAFFKDGQLIKMFVVDLYCSTCRPVEYPY